MQRYYPFTLLKVAIILLLNILIIGLVSLATGMPPLYRPASVISACAPWLL